VASECGITDWTCGISYNEINAFEDGSLPPEPVTLDFIGKIGATQMLAFFYVSSAF
jgi:hypothetical protein